MQVAILPRHGSLMHSDPRDAARTGDSVPLPDYPGMMLVVSAGPCLNEPTIFAWVNGDETERRCTKPLVIVTAEHGKCYVMRDAFGGLPTLCLGDASFRMAMPSALFIATAHGIVVLDSDD